LGRDKGRVRRISGFRSFGLRMSSQAREFRPAGLAMTIRADCTAQHGDWYESVIGIGSRRIGAGDRVGGGGDPDDRHPSTSISRSADPHLPITTRKYNDGTQIGRTCC